VGVALNLANLMLIGALMLRRPSRPRLVAA
jgi:hypothetical protein